MLLVMGEKTTQTYTKCNETNDMHACNDSMLISISNEFYIWIPFCGAGGSVGDFTRSFSRSIIKQNVFYAESPKDHSQNVKIDVNEVK